MHASPVLKLQATMSDISDSGNDNVTVLDSADPLDPHQEMDATLLPYPVSFQVKGFLLRDISLRFNSLELFPFLEVTCAAMCSQHETRDLSLKRLDDFKLKKVEANRPNCSVFFLQM